MRMPIEIETRPAQAIKPDLGQLCHRIAQERALAATNQLKPYRSQVMPWLQRLSPVDLGALLDRLDVTCARYLLLESFQAPHPDRAAAWLAHASPTTVTRLLEALCDDEDGRRQARALLRHLPPEQAAAALLHLSQPASPDGGSTEPGPELLDDLSPVVAARLHTALAWHEMGFHRALVWLEEQPPDIAAFALHGLAPDRQVCLLDRLPARVRDCLQPRLLPSSRHQWPARPSRPAPLWRIVQDRFLDTGLRWTWMEGELQAQAGSFDRLRTGSFDRPVLSSSAVLTVNSAKGLTATPATRVLSQWSPATSTRGGRTQPWPLRVDLLAMDPAHVRLVARRAISESDLIPIAEVLAQLGPRSRTDERPSGALFDQLGLVRLSEAVAATGAIAGINGGFYFDYGHYLDAHDLGLDLASIPGLAFGELAGWFVSGGITDVSPIFNRAALLITADGQPHIRRVFTSRLHLAGHWITWDTVNERRSPEQIVLYNAVVGQRTPVAPAVVDVTIARGRVRAIRRGGGQPLPLWGAAISVPQARAPELLGDLHVGDLATFDAGLPAHLGHVVEAIACGPQLVRDGEVDLDFDFEHFGRKDTTVLPLSLTRAVNFFRAARSFVMLRRGELVLGTVSGTALGAGSPPVSAGLTLGELARLVVSLGGEQAVALDGGGSSTLVALDGKDGEHGGAPRVLNVPTGGSDVSFGEERYINTYWLVFRGSEQVGWTDRT